MTSYRLTLALMVALSVLLVAPIVAAAMKNPTPTVWTYDQLQRSL